MYVQLHNENRHQKRSALQWRIKKGYVLQDYENTVQGRVRRLERKFGYDFCIDKQTSTVLKQQAQQFHDKAMKYLGGSYYCKKQTRFDKMKMKEQFGFKMEENKIKKVFKRVEFKIEIALKSLAFRMIMKHK